MITLEPLGARLVAKQFDDDKIGSIYVPEHAKQGSLRATVIATGKDCVWVEEGDTILVGRYAKFDVPLRGEEWRDHFILNEDDTLAKIHTKEGEEDA